MSDGETTAIATASTQRYRVNLKENAKGAVSVDCTAECGDKEAASVAAVTLLADTKVKLKEIGRALVDD